jgi:hypothetical protein
MRNHQMWQAQARQRPPSREWLPEDLRGDDWLDIAGPDFLDRMISGLIANTPDSTVASGWLGFWEKFGGASFLTQSYNSTTGLPIRARHFTEPLKGLGKMAARASAGLDVLISGLEIARILKSDHSALNKGTKVGVVVAMNVAVFMGVGAATLYFATTFVGAVIAGIFAVFAATVSEKIKKFILNIIDAQVE